MILATYRNDAGLDFPAMDHSEQSRPDLALAQAVASLEDCRLQVARLAEENAALQARLQAEEAKRIGSEAQARLLETPIRTVDLVPTTGPSATEEALRIAIEALRIMVEELEQADEMLLSRSRILR